MMDIIGWIGALMLAVCGLPQCVKSIKDKHSDGISMGFILLWLFGEIFSTIYVIHQKEYPIVFNCLMNLVFVNIILYYKLKKVLLTREEKVKEWFVTNGGSYKEYNKKGKISYREWEDGSYFIYDYDKNHEPIFLYRCWNGTFNNIEFMNIIHIPTKML